jgi:hypothetical protein
LASEQSHQRFHVSLARSLGQLAVIAHFDAVGEVAASVLQLAPDAAFVAGVISNIEDLSGLVRRARPTLDEAEQFFPAYSTDEVRRTLELVVEPHVRKLLLGDIEGAYEAATDELAKEEFASSCAVLGHVDRCLGAIEDPAYPSKRTVGPLMTSCVECFRTNRMDEAGALLQTLSERWPQAAWMKVHVSAGLLGRLPWPGYPYPDF